ncbi:MAG TPA: hypothetical protein VKN18_01020 [Blastocatellia bacterium]|nr:hypothetical protein [Blastocatellia bacterium]
MRKAGIFICALSLLIPSTAVFGRTPQDSERYPPNCERIRIVLKNGKRIEAESYKRDGEQIEIIRKGAIQRVPNIDIKRIEVTQGYCPDAVISLNTGKQIKGYLREWTCDRQCIDCTLVLVQNKKPIVIPSADIKSKEIKDRVPWREKFRDKLIDISLIPLLPVYAILFYIGCRHGCD